jgi:enoyl-CoA hydratase
VYRTLALDVRPPVAEITLTADTGDPACFDELAHAVARLSDEASVHAVLLMLAQGPPSGTCGDVAVSGGAVLRSLELLPQPMIAVVEGAAEGVAVEMCLACDIRVASEGATFALTEIPALGATQRLPRLIGRTRAAEMILAGTRVDAATAFAWGLVNAVTPAGGARVRAERIAASICQRGPLAVRYAKEAVARGADMPLDQALRYETDLTVILQTTSDRAEGVRAFLEKRQPRFEGR